MEENITNLLDEQLFATEFAHLKDTCYLDQTGAALYARSQVEAIANDLRENLYSNPHSNSLPSKLCGDTVDQVRYRVLQYFNTTTNDYNVIFTSGATEALKIVAETFDFMGKSSLDQDGLISSEDSTGMCGELVYLQDNHTSVLGMRSVDNVTKNHVTSRCLSPSEAFQAFAGFPTTGVPLFREPDQEVPTENSNLVVATKPNLRGNSLFVFPAQCNFSGIKYPLSWIEHVQDGVLENQHFGTSRHCEWFCLLDAATYVSTNPLDLSSVRPDFVTISFYKMFGLPTGLGALLVRNSSAPVLHKRYYGGGTVQVALSSRPTHVLRPVLHQRFEDGTINFLSIIALRHSLDWQTRTGLSLQAVGFHCYRLARYTFARLLTLHHSNGYAAVRLYTDTAYDDPDTQGGIVNFNMCRDDGQFVGFMEVLTLANLHGIHLRVGCFCNPGACQRHLGITDQQYYENFEAGHVCGDDKDLIDGRPTGSVRVSFGPYSRQEHADRLVLMLTECFVTKPAVHKEPDYWKDTAELLRKKFDGSHHKQIQDQSSDSRSPAKDRSPVKSVENTILQNNRHPPLSSSLCLTDYSRSPSVVLSQVCLYPVKSCGGMPVDHWSLDHRGLLYDRCWMIVTDSGVALTQKQEPRMCLIKPVVDLDRRLLRLTFNGYPSCTVPLDCSQTEVSVAWLCQSKVCGDNVRGEDCGPPAADWLALVLHRDRLRLIRQSDSVKRPSKKKDLNGVASDLALSNQAQFLLVNENSVAWLTDKLPDTSDCPKTNMVDRFRSNFVIRGNLSAFEEQKWKAVKIGSISFKVDGPCGRCQMICIDQSTGERTKEPLTTLAANCQGSMKFGIYLSQQDPAADTAVSVGDLVIPSLT